MKKSSAPPPATRKLLAKSVGQDPSACSVWPFDPVAWARIQAATGEHAAGDPSEIWGAFNQALLFTVANTGPARQPPLKDLRANRKKLLQTIDSLINQLGVDADVVSSPELRVDATAWITLVDGQTRLIRPTAQMWSSNFRSNRVTTDEAPRPSIAVQDRVQKKVVRMLRRLSSDLPTLRASAASALEDVSISERRGIVPPLGVLTFVRRTAFIYQMAYGRPPRPGSKQSNGKTSPAVRFIEAAATEVRKSKTITTYRAELKSALHMTSNTINRVLAQMITASTKQTTDPKGWKKV